MVLSKPWKFTSEILTVGIPTKNVYNIGHRAANYSQQQAFSLKSLATLRAVEPRPVQLDPDVQMLTTEHCTLSLIIKLSLLLIVLVLKYDFYHQQLSCIE